MKSKYKDIFVDHALELAWSLWAELGVSGWQRHHTSHAIDLELLILYTSGLGDRDPRLRDEATDWCAVFGRNVAGARLRNLLNQMNGPVRSGYEAFAATVNAHSSHKFPEAAVHPRKFRPTGRSESPDLQRPSLLALRLRGSFGVTARAEILRFFLADPGREYTASDLAPEAGYTKRNIADALESLGASGILEPLLIKNQIRYRLFQREPLLALVGELPLVFPRWRLVFPMLLQILELAEKTGKISDRSRWVEASKLLAEFESALRLVKIGPPAETDPAKRWEAFEEWSLRLVGDWSAGRFGDTLPSTLLPEVLSSGRLRRGHASTR